MSKKLTKNTKTVSKDTKTVSETEKQIFTTWFNSFENKPHVYKVKKVGNKLQITSSLGNYTLDL